VSQPFLGEVKIISWNFPPKNWAFCNGQSLAINQNQALFSILGTMYGGNGQTTFALPDLRGRTAIHREEVDEALLRQSVGSQQARRLSTKERLIVAYHEAGHALCRKLLGLDPPEILSIVPRGPALGFVGHSPQEDSYLKSRDQLLDELVTLLGGRAAEEEVLGESYSGAVDDLSRVHLVCKQMVGEFGMGVPVDHDGPPPIAMPTGDYAVSDETRREEMKEQTNIFRVLVKTLVNAGIITDRTKAFYAMYVDIDELKAEGDKMVGDDIAEEGIKYLQEINFAEKARAVLIAAE